MQKLSISRAPDRSPHRFIVAGRKGVGKTHLVSTIEGVFFIPLEGLRGKSPDHDPAFFSDPTNPNRPAPVPTLGDLERQLDLFAEEAKSGGFRHLALDSMTAIERLVHIAAVGREKVDHMGAAEFKACWDAASALWLRLQNKLDSIRLSRNLHIWLIAHAVQAYEDDLKTGDSYRRWDLAFRGRNQDVAELRVMWSAWADHVLFLDWQTSITPGTKKKRAVARLESRMLFCRETAQHAAKSRGLPATLPATWADLERALRGSRANAEPRLRKRIAETIESLLGEDRTLIEADLAKAKTIATLEAVLSRAEGMAAVAAAEADDDAEEESEPPPAEIAVAEPPKEPEPKRATPRKRQQATPAEPPSLPPSEQQAFEAANAEAAARAARLREEAERAKAAPTPPPSEPKFEQTVTAPAEVKEVAITAIVTEPIDDFDADAAAPPTDDPVASAVTIDAVRAILDGAGGLPPGPNRFELEKRCYVRLIEETPIAQLHPLAAELSRRKDFPGDIQAELRAAYGERKKRDRAGAAA